MPASKQRRAAERRRLRRQAQRRQQQLARRRRINVIVSIAGTLVLAGVVVGLIVATSGSDSKKPAAASSARPSSSAATRSGATSSGATTSTASTSATPTPAAPSSKASTARPTTTTSTTRTSTTSTPTTSTTASTAGAVSTTCRYPVSGTAARKVSTPPDTASTRGTVTVHLTTSQGSMTFSLNRAAAPCAVNSVVSLIRQKYYNQTSCHRLVTKSIYVLQCGDPTGTGRGGPGYSFADELGTSTVFRRGSVVMANGGPNTNGSQFFIVDKDTNLGSYTPLGTVTSGLAVVDKVYRAGTSDGSTDGPPKLRFTFRTVSVA